MARIRAQLLVLLSLLSQPFQSFRYNSTHAQNSPADFRSRVYKLRETQTLLIGQLDVLVDTRRQNEPRVRTNNAAAAAAGDCDYDRAVYKAFSETAIIPDSLLKRDLTAAYPKDRPELSAVRDSSAYLDHAERLQADNTERTDDYRNASVASDRLQRSYANLLDAELSSLRSILLQWTGQKILQQDSDSFYTEPDETSDDSPSWEGRYFQTERRRTNANLSNKKGGNNYWGSIGSEDGDENQRTEFDFDQEENEHEAEDGDWWGLELDWQDQEHTSLSDSFSFPTETDEQPEDQRTHAAESSAATDLARLSYWMRTSHYGSRDPYTEKEPEGNPENQKEEWPGGEDPLGRGVSGSLRPEILANLPADKWIPGSLAKQILEHHIQQNERISGSRNQEILPQLSASEPTPGYLQEKILADPPPSGQLGIWGSPLQQQQHYQQIPVLSKRIPGHFQGQVLVHGRDDRHRVLLPQMRKFPFSNIARLSTGCTGTLVTPRHVLTVAHCVHNGFGFRDNLEKLKIQIPDTMGFKNYYAQKITIPTGWLRQYEHDTNARSRRGRGGGRGGRGAGGGGGKRAMYDYAVVHLTLAVAGRTRFLPLAVPRPEVLQMDFHFLAFPEDDRRLWWSVCLASKHMAFGDGNLIMTRCDAAVGNSGAAVFIQDPNHGGLKVVGVLSNTVHVGQGRRRPRSYRRYSIITAITWPKLTHICRELDVLGQVYSVCPPAHYMRRPPPSSSRQQELKVVPFFGKRGAAVKSHHRRQGRDQGRGSGDISSVTWSAASAPSSADVQRFVGVLPDKRVTSPGITASFSSAAASPRTVPVSGGSAWWPVAWWSSPRRPPPAGSDKMVDFRQSFFRKTVPESWDASSSVGTSPSASSRREAPGRLSLAAALLPAPSRRGPRRRHRAVNVEVPLIGTRFPGTWSRSAAWPGVSKRRGSSVFGAPLLRETGRPGS